MYETVYFILNIDEKSKIINVDQKIFSANIDRNEYKNALLEQRKIYVMCSNEGYQVNLEGFTLAFANIIISSSVKSKR